MAGEFIDSNWYARGPFALSDNPPFKFPDDSIRFLDAQRQADEAKGIVSKSSSPDRSEYKLHRGFIRNLQPASLKASPIYRCKFQFNPQEISQSVSMREDIYNPILLTPEQLSQPIGGTVNFQFDLFFDRSHELSEDWDRGALVWDSDTGAEATNSVYAAHKFGVFADLKMLYSAIGQGITDQLIQQQIDNIRNFYDAKSARDKEYTGTGEDTTDKAETDTATLKGTFSEDFDQGKLESTLATNIGNSAFLIPNPVRIVFSDLFMVDGFVTGTRVDFLKFNNYMIPMQCRVAMSVNAMYIGFAKNRTFLTTTISSAIDTLETENTESTKAANEIAAALQKIGPFILAFESFVYIEGASFPEPNWNNAANGGVVNSSLYRFLVPESKMGQNQRIAYSGFKGIVPREGTGKDVDAILSLFEDVNRTPFSISYSWSMSIYGKTNQNGNSGIGWTQQQATSMLANGADGNPLFMNGSNSDLVGLYEFSGTATDKSTWGYGASGGGATADKIRRLTYKSVPNTSTYELDTDSYENNIRNSYYIVVWDIQITVSTGSIENVYFAAPTSSSSLTPKVRRGTEATGYDALITLVDYARGVK